MSIDVKTMHFINIKGNKDFFYACNDYTVKLEDIHGVVISKSGNTTFHIKFDSEEQEWVMHRIGLPALEMNGDNGIKSVAFFEDGKSCKIEDLSISDEERCMLLLKYDKGVNGMMEYYHWYNV